MNREKKQLAVVGVLVVLILGVGAFQFMRGSEPPPVATAKETKATEVKPEKAEPKNVGLPPLAQKDPFQPSTFITEGTTVANDQVPPKQPVQQTHGKPKLGIDPDFQLDRIKFGPAGTKEVKPVEPPKPEFGYNLIGIIDGAHPAAVFEDGQGNQQLVEVGQGIGPSATITTISRGTVRVKFNAETLVFNVGGNPHAK